MTPAAENKLIIGVGNDQRGDDGVGLWLAKRLRARQLPGVAVQEFRGSPALLLDRWKNATAVCLIDATFSGALPGSVFRFDASEETLPRRKFRCSTHGGGVEEAVELARVLNRLPQRLVVYGIEGKSFAMGKEISQEVKAGAERTVGAILEDLGFGGRARATCMSGD